MFVDRDTKKMLDSIGVDKNDPQVRAFLNDRGTQQVMRFLDRTLYGPKPAPKPDPVLPECNGFQGTGTRCTQCRVRKGIHE